MRTQTKYIDTFVAAIEAGSFVRAAEQLHVTPSTVSYQIRQLEEWIGAPLFERSARKVLPTALAERLFAICGQFIDEIGTLRAAARGRAGATREAMRIATGSSFGRYVLTPILSGDAFADTVINLRFGTDDEVCAAVAAGRADLGFSYTMVASNSLTFELVYRYPLVLIAPFAQKPSGALAKWVADAGFITYDDCEPAFAGWFDAQLGGMPPQMRTMGRCTEIEEAIAMVAAGRGLSIVPAYMLDAALRAKRVRAITPRGVPATTDTVFRVLRKGSLLDTAGKNLLQAVTQADPAV
ncbi:MAG: LysR family transcriptional regulator [Janthinobacterium lividum]